MRSLIAALSFLTRIPVGRSIPFASKEIARSAGWFPVVGLLLGSIYCSAALLLKNHLPLLVLAVLLTALDALLTGGLHYDGLADSFDGFGGGKDRDAVLRIMRDHAIGSFGAIAMILAIIFRITGLASMIGHDDPIGHDRWMKAIVLTPALSRWSILPLAAFLPSARPVAVMNDMRMAQLAWGTACTVTALVLAKSLYAAWAFLVVCAVTLAFGFYCKKRIGGSTGDTLGANILFCESAALLVFLWGMH